MKATRRNICIVFLFCIAAVTGCGNAAKERYVNPPGWEPESYEASPPVPLGHPGEAGIPGTLTAPFNAEQFARDLSGLFTRAAADIARLSTETRIDFEFPTDAAALLEKSAAALETLANEGYETVEMEILDAYGAYADKVGPMEDMINLGEGMQDAYEDKTIGDPLYSLELLEIKQESWRTTLKRVKGQLAAERNKFVFTKGAMLISREASIGADQQAIVESLETDLMALAGDYALRVQSAIDMATEEAGLKPVLDRFEGVDIKADTADFEADFESKFRTVQRITGSDE